MRVRQACRGDLMRAPHRLTKRLLRQGIVYCVYCRGAAWTGARDRWLRGEAVPQLRVPATGMALDADGDHVQAPIPNPGAVI